MPKVSSLKLKINGETKEFPVYYKKKKFFLNTFPDEILVFVKQGNATFNRDEFDSEAEMEKFYTQLIDDYHAMVSKTRKVIAYHLNVPSNFHTLPGITPELARMFGYAGDNAYGFYIQWGIYFEKTGDGRSFFSINKDGSLGAIEHVPLHQSIIIDYTPERDSFFKQLEEKMKELFLKVALTMMDEQKMLLMTDFTITKLLT